MTFLNPAFLFGLLAAGIPVIIHLLNLRKLQRVDFSTLRFLKELQKNQIRKIKLRQWLLLLLRVLLIIFLVTAFSRPALKGVSVAGIASSAKTTAVIVLDNSFSMEVIDKDGSLFNKAKASALSLVNTLQEGDEVALLTTTAKLDEPVLTKNLTEVKKKIKELTISGVLGNINNAVLQAAPLLESSSNYNKEVFIFSDFQQTGLNEGNSVTDLSQIFNERVHVYLVPVNKPNIYNTGIDDLVVNSEILEPGKNISITVTLTNYSAEREGSSIISLYLNGERVAQKSVALNPEATLPIEFEIPLTASGFTTLMAGLEDDDISGDNLRYASFSLPDKLNTLLLYDTPEDIQFLSLALQVGFDKKEFSLTTKPASSLSGLDLSKYQAIVLTTGAFPIDVTQLNNYLQSGKGGVLVFPSVSAKPELFRAALVSLHLPASGILAGVPGEYNKPVYFEKIVHDHPLFGGIYEKANEKTGSPDIYSYFQIFPGNKGKAIISLADNSAVLSEYTSENGRILLFSIPPDLRFSNLPLKGLFVPLLYRSVYYLSGTGQKERSVFTGEPLRISTSGIQKNVMKIRKPSGQEEFINNDLLTSNSLSFLQTESPGVYDFFSGTELIARKTANHKPGESVTKSADENEILQYFKTIGTANTPVLFKSDTNIAEEITQARFGTELWKIFLVLALITALIEMAVARISKKDLTPDDVE